MSVSVLCYETWTRSAAFLEVSVLGIEKWRRSMLGVNVAEVIILKRYISVYVASDLICFPLVTQMKSIEPIF